MTKAIPRRRGRPVDGSGEETRERCLDAARKVFSVYGFGAAGMRVIATDAGITPMALYNYFPSKTALYRATWEHAIEQMYAEYEKVVAGRSSLTEEIDAIFDHAADTIRDRPDVIRLVLRSLLDAEQDGFDDLHPTPDAVPAFYAALAARAVERGEIEPSDAQRVTTLVLTLLWGTMTIAVYDPATLDGSVASAKWAMRHRLEEVRPRR